MNKNQHSISRVLLERFRMPRMPLQCYQVATGEWIPKSVERACAWPGYNQLLVLGEVDDTLEDAFSKVESGLRKTFKALEEAAHSERTELPASIYANMCWYCAFLKLIALYSKPGAVVSFVFQLNWELGEGKYDLLRDLNVPNATVSNWRKQHALGRRVIIDAENCLQLLFRFQFQRAYKVDYAQFQSTKWHISVSPTELVMSDVGLVPLNLNDHKAVLYLLPLGPHLLLEGIFFHDLTKNSSQPIVRGQTLTAEEAEYRFDILCSSAVNEIICRAKIPNIPESITRAKMKGITFHRIVNPKQVGLSGLADVGNGDFRFQTVSAEEYKTFMHTYMLPMN